MSVIELAGLSKTYPNGVEAVKGLDLTVADGEFMVLVGPSGCGKSTALRMIAGLEDITDGTLTIDGERVNGVKPKDRDIAMVFQNYALYPHKTVAENIGFPLKIEGCAKPEIETRVRQVATTLEITELLGTKPGELSGGQRQRVAMGRAIIRQPRAFLMDEPLSNLDAKLRAQMRAEILALQSDMAVTTVYVTHDQVEAMTMGDRVAVLRDGTLQQVAAPQAIYDQPVNVFVAAFIGSPSINLFSAEVVRDDGTWLVASDAVRIQAGDLLAGRGISLDTDRVTVGIRPEDLYDAALRPDLAARAVVDAHVELVEPLGPEMLVHLETGTQAVESGDPDAAEDGAATRTWTAKFSSDSSVAQGQRAQTAINLDRLYLFDEVTGQALSHPIRATTSGGSAASGQDDR